MQDIKYLKSQIDLRFEVEKDLGPPTRRGSNEWTFPCPFVPEKTVGGFRVWSDRYFCFSCGEKGDVFDWRQKIHNQSLQEAIKHFGGTASVDRETVIKYAAERAEQAARELEQKIEQAQKALADLRSAQVWLKYHEQLKENNEARRLWRECGIPDVWQDWWSLGYCEHYSLWRKGESDWEEWWKSPTLSIPIWGHSWEVYNVKHRLLEEPPDGGKYVQEKKHVPQYPFITNPDYKKGELLLVEGEKKSMVTFLACDDPDLQVAGIPGALPSEECLKVFDNYDPIYVCLDPDAYDEKPGGSPISKLVDKLGSDRTRIIWLPRKIDDAILDKELTGYMIKRLMRSARKCVV